MDACERLAGAIRFKTVSKAVYEETDFGVFDDYLAYIKESFPLFQEKTELTVVDDRALVYVWRGAAQGAEGPGAGSGGEALPLALMAHYDVVPVDEATESSWTHGGFSGDIADGRIWGRGTLDIKSQMLAHMEACEILMREGFTPARDIYFVYGNDEETDSEHGAKKILEYFVDKGLRFDGLLDEGGTVSSGLLDGVDVPIALIGVAEKGYCDFQISIKGAGGHSSMPPKHTALGDISRLICEIEKHPMPARLMEPTISMLENISPEMGGAARLAIRFRSVFGALLLKILSGGPSTNALIRTTLAATVSRSGSAPNVLPNEAYLNVNARILHGDTVASVKEYILSLAEKAGIKGLEISEYTPGDPGEISPASGRCWDVISGAVKALYPDAVITPFLMTGLTDGGRYTPVCKHIYRFTPYLLSEEEVSYIHNINENISIDNYGRMIEFYRMFISEY